MNHNFQNRTSINPRGNRAKITNSNSNNTWTAVARGKRWSTVAIASAAAVMVWKVLFTGLRSASASASGRRLIAVIVRNERIANCFHRKIAVPHTREMKFCWGKMEEFAVRKWREGSLGRDKEEDGGGGRKMK